MCVILQVLFKSCLVGAFISLSKATVLLEIVGGKTSFQEGDEAQLLCTISPYNNEMTWYVNNGIYADCFLGSCGPSSNKPYTFKYNFDEVGGKFILTIDEVNSSHANLSFACDDGNERKTITFQVTTGSANGDNGISWICIIIIVFGILSVLVYIIQLPFLVCLLRTVMSSYLLSTDMSITITAKKKIYLGKSDIEPFKLEPSRKYRPEKDKDHQHCWLIVSVIDTDSGLYELSFEGKIFITRVKVITSVLQIATDLRIEALSKFYPKRTIVPVDQVDKSHYMKYNYDVEENHNKGYRRVSWCNFPTGAGNITYIDEGETVTLHSLLNSSGSKCLWRKGISGSSLIEECSRYRFDKKKDLIISDVATSDTGIYKLYQGETLNRVIYLFATEKNKMPLSTSIIKISENADFVLPNFDKEHGLWLQSSSVKTELLEPKSGLHFETIKRNHDTNFRCISEKIMIHDARVIANETGEDRLIYEIMIREGHELFLYNPFKDNVKWEKDNKGLKTDKNGNLHIDQVTIQHSGIYTCKCPESNQKGKIKVALDNTNTEKFALRMALFSMVPIFGCIAVFVLNGKVKHDRRSVSLRAGDMFLIFLICFPIIGIFFSIMNLCRCTENCFPVFFLFKRKSVKRPGSVKPKGKHTGGTSTSNQIADKSV